MSSALPCGRPSTTSKITTSPSSRSAICSASTPPMLPPPIKAILGRAMGGLPSRLHVPDDGVAELRALEELGTVHQAVEVVGDGLGGDRAVHAADDPLGGLVPAQVPEHHLARQDHGAGIHLVEVR